MLIYFGPKGWLAQFLQFFHLYDGPIRLTHNYTGVLISLVISGFPFAFLLILSYITGIDPGLARAAATLGADPQGAVPPHLPAAARAGARDVLLPRVRAGVLGVPVGGAAGLAGGPDARDLDRRVRGGVRAVRLFARVGDRDDHGLRAARDRRRGARACATCSIAARWSEARDERDAQWARSTARGAACCSG